MAGVPIVKNQINVQPNQINTTPKGQNGTYGGSSPSIFLTGTAGKTGKSTSIWAGLQSDKNCPSR